MRFQADDDGSPRPNRDQRGSNRIRLAKAMLSRGDSLDDIADLTGVPAPMLELIRDIDQPPSSIRTGRAWPLIAALVTIETVAATNIIVGVTALIRHDITLGVLSGALAVSLALTVVLIAKNLSPTLAAPTVHWHRTDSAADPKTQTPDRDKAP